MFGGTSWIIAALTGMFAFACMTLTLKKLTYSLPTPVVLLYLFLITGGLYLVYGIKLGLRFSVSPSQLGFLGLAAAFAFIGNLGDIEALRMAPNPGYASAVKAGQIVLITFAALLLFAEQKLSWQGVGGVVLVVTGVGLLATQR